MYYPIDDHKDEILSLVEYNPVLIIDGEPGCGKTTQVAQWLRSNGALLTQPGRLHAKENSRRVAVELRVQLGQEVGYHIARENRSSDWTEILYTTDGMPIVIKHVESGRFHYLIIDEVHEWSENIELLVMWSKLKVKENPDFRVILMSGTLDSERLSKYFNGAPVVKISGRLHPIVEIEKGLTDVDDVLKMHKLGKNILFFKEGKPEIEDLIAKLKQLRINAEILPLYRELDPDEQRKVFSAFTGLRIIVATNICESSMTIPYIDCVIDSGYEKVMVYENGVQSIRLLPIALDSKTQRKNRAGRCSPGVCIDRCNVPLNERPKYSTPEIQRIDLSRAYLQLKVKRISLEKVELFHQPDPKKVEEAISLLKSLGCLDNEGEVTKKGFEVSDLPGVAPYIGCMILEAKKRKCLPEIIKIAAILSQEGFVNSKNSAWKNLCNFSVVSDLIAQMQLLDYLVKHPIHYNNMRELGIIISSFKRVRDTANNLADKLDVDLDQPLSENHDDILQCILSGMMDKIFYLKGKYLVNTSTSEARKFSFSSNCNPVRDNFYVGNPLTLSGQHGSNISLVTLLSRIKVEWLMEIAPDEFSKKTVGTGNYDFRDNSFTDCQEIYFQNVCFDKENISDPTNKRKREIFLDWLVELHFENQYWNQIYKLDSKLYDVVMSNRRFILAHFDYNRYVEIRKRRLKPFLDNSLPENVTSLRDLNSYGDINLDLISDVTKIPTT